MGLSIQNLRDSLRKATGQDATDMPSADADLYLNRAYWELLDKFPFREKEVRGTWPTVAAVKAYNVPVLFDALRHLAVVDPDSDEHIPLDQLASDPYEAEFVEGTDQDGIPTGYIREGSQIVLWPTPDDVYTIVMRYWTQLADLATGVNPSIPPSFHEIILLGAIWRAFLDAGDYQRAEGAKQHQVALLGSSVPVEAKEEENNPRAHLEVIRTPYP